MYRYIDSHAHIYLPDYSHDISQVIERARQKNVEKIFMPNIDSKSIASMLDLVVRYPEMCVPMMGIHPCYIKEDYEKELEVAESWLGQHDFCAIGEIGIDLHWDTSTKDWQVEAFEKQINWAKELRKPIVIHCRESIELTIELVRNQQKGDLKGIFHCFTGTLDQAKEVIDLGFLLGIGGVATFKNGGMDKVIPHVSLDHMVLETDSPYLSPVPFRGKRNEPGHVTLVAERIAELQYAKLSEVTERTSINALELFDHVG